MTGKGGGTETDAQRKTQICIETERGREGGGGGSVGPPRLSTEPSLIALVGCEQKGGDRPMERKLESVFFGGGIVAKSKNHLQN